MAPEKKEEMKKSFFAWFNPTNITTVFSAIGVCWMIMWQGGRAAYFGVSNFKDSVEVTRQRALETKYNLSVFIENQHVRDAGQDADISNVRSEKIESN